MPQPTAFLIELESTLDLYGVHVLSGHRNQIEFLSVQVSKEVSAVGLTSNFSICIWRIGDVNEGASVTNSMAVAPWSLQRLGSAPLLTSASTMLSFPKMTAAINGVKPDAWCPSTAHSSLSPLR